MDWNQSQAELYKAVKAAKAAELENAALRRALHDAIKRPLGVVPDSALPFYDPVRYYGKDEE